MLKNKNPKIPKHNKVLKDTEADKEKEKLHKANEKEYCKFILACFNIVRKGTMDKLPTGNAFLAWNKIKERFNPQKFANSKLTHWKNSPDDWIELEIITCH